MLGYLIILTDTKRKDIYKEDRMSIYIVIGMGFAKLKISAVFSDKSAAEMFLSLRLHNAGYIEEMVLDSEWQRLKESISVLKATADKI
jgi:hypothetical protein